MTELTIKIIATVGDKESAESFQGFSEVFVDRPKVQLQFLGPTTKLIDTENPFDTLVMNSFCRQPSA